MKQSIFLALALGALLMVCCRIAVASGDEDEPTGEETTTTATEGPSRYRGSEEEGLPLFRQAEEAYQARRYEEAARLLEQAYAEHEHPLLAFNLGQAHRNAENYEAALTAYRNYIQLCPRDELVNRVYILIGECLLQLDRRQEANEAFQHYLDLESDGEYAAQAERAIESGETPTDQDRRDPETVNQAREVCNRAARLWEQEQFAEAAELFLRGYERMPDMHEFLYNAGLCYLDAQAWDDASRTLRRYLQTPGAEHDAWAFLGECYGEMFDFSEAMEAYERYLQLEPRGTYADEARAFVNELYSAEGDETRTETGATPGEVERATALYDQAREHYDADRYQEALECLRQAYEIVPARSLVYNIGVTYQAMEEWQQAVDHFERFLQGGETGISADAHIDAAECLLELDRTQDAVQHIERFIALAEEHELPREERNTERARELQQRAQGGGGE